MYWLILACFFILKINLHCWMLPIFPVASILLVSTAKDLDVYQAPALKFETFAILLSYDIFISLKKLKQVYLLKSHSCKWKKTANSSSLSCWSGYKQKKPIKLVLSMELKVGFFQKVMAKFSNLSKWHSCEPKIVPELLFLVHGINKILVIFWIHLAKKSAHYEL